MSSDDRHKIYFNEEEDRHQYGTGCLVHKDMVSADLGYRAVSSRLILIRLRAAPFNVTIIKIYAPTSGHEANAVDNFYQQLQEIIEQTPKKDILANTLGPHKPPRRWTWHSPDRKHKNHIDYILVRKRFQSRVNVQRTRGFPGADIRSDHDLVMTIFRVRLKKAKKPTQSRLTFDLEKLRNPHVAGTFQATVGGKFALLIKLREDDIDIDNMT